MNSILKNNEIKNNEIKNNEIENKNIQTIQNKFNTFDNPELNSLLQYIYISLRSYPPPDTVIIKCETDVRILPNKLYKSISVKLNQEIMKIIFAISKHLLNENINKPNLILSYEDIEKLYSMNILPKIKIDYSTIA
jgi:hypothetical protein